MSSNLEAMDEFIRSASARLASRWFLELRFEKMVGGREWKALYVPGPHFGRTRGLPDPVAAGAATPASP